MNWARYGEEGIRIVFGNAVSADVHEKVRRYYFFLKSLRLQEIIDIIPSFTTCIIYFNDQLTDFDTLTAHLQEKERELPETDVPAPTAHTIPVMYGGQYGPDMDFVCSYAGLTPDEIIEIHAGAVYTVFAVGFMPGFPYMGTLDRRLFVPRLETPRLKVNEGSVGIAQFQTGIYSFESPGGWRIIGKTDRRLFDHRQEPFSLMKIGDQVRFVPV
ncbi:MAG: 5-oxoprolinase subunit PxpB [Syntrophorhabdaceae bacterium]|nr:5-oxoprolinase subunit PxpB [Syntrophorhabdaceae bacterium]